MNAIARFGLALSLLLLASPLSAQSISFGLRGTGSVPTGSFSETPTTGSTNATLIQGAKSGFGYGAEAGLSFGMFGAYASFDHIKFDCETATCTTNGKYTLQGVTAGLKVSVPMMSRFRPFVKGGLTYNDLKGSYGGSSSGGLTTDRNAGFELGVGGDYGLLGIFSITPQLRYVGQNFKRRVPGVTNTSTIPNSGVDYFTFDLGLSLHTPFGM
jgi:opacity protein-like surface antigen